MEKNNGIGDLLVMASYRLALVGLNFGSHVLKDFLPGGQAAAYFQLAAVCDLNEELVRRKGAEHGVPWTTSLDNLLADDSIQVIGLFTGPVGRAALIDKITAAGKHVMTTKPFETDPEASFILDKARARGCAVMMNSPQSIAVREDLQTIRQWVEEYSLGEPIAVHTETYASYREKADGSWYDDPAKCPVAPLFRLSIYMLNDLVALFGGVDSLSVMTNRRFTERPTPDNATALLQFQNGMLASLFSSFCIDDTEPYQDSMILHFARGTIYKNIMRGVRYQGGEEVRETVLDLIFPCENRREIQQKRLAITTGSYPWEHLNQAISTGDFSSMPDPENVAQALWVVAALQRAENSGSQEKVIRPA